MSIQVDQVSGVGTLIKPGDRVDVVVGITGADKFPVVTVDPDDRPGHVPVAGLNATSVKAIIQNLEVVGTLLPPPPAAEDQPDAPADPPRLTAPGTQLVLLAVTAQEAEVLRFAQIDGTSRSSSAPPRTRRRRTMKTTGITLRQLVDGWAVIPPQIVEAVDPSRSRSRSPARGGPRGRPGASHGSEPTIANPATRQRPTGR